MSDEILTAQEAADFLKISTKLLYKLINAGELPAKKIGNGFRLKKSVLLAYMNEDVFDTLSHEEASDLLYNITLGKSRGEVNV
jgi:excisionase family DNA binding protein